MIATIEMSVDAIWLVIFLSVGIMAISSFIGNLEENVCWKRELVKRGLAEYYLDKDHQRQWRLLIDREKNQAEP